MLPGRLDATCGTVDTGHPRQRYSAACGLGRRALSEYDGDAKDGLPGRVSRASADSSNSTATETVSEIVLPNSNGPSGLHCRAEETINTTII